VLYLRVFFVIVVAFKVDKEDWINLTAFILEDALEVLYFTKQDKDIKIKLLTNV
jgi:hypothetical protein